MKILLLAALFALANAKHEQYIGWKSYFVGPASSEQLASLHSNSNKFNLDILSRPTVQNAGLTLVHPDSQEGFVSTLENLGITYSIHVNDVKVQLDRDDEITEAYQRSLGKFWNSSLPYENYQNWETIVSYLSETAERNPNITKLVKGGLSSEGRDLYYLKISSTDFEDWTKPVIVIDAAIHAREWIGIPVATWIINKLTDELDEADLLEKFDWIIIPVVNPDGYVYSHDYDRFWRKTRSNHTEHWCLGADANRNFDHYWNTEGVSQYACDETYAGVSVLSEPEAQFVSSIINEHLARIALYLTLHSYGSTITYPWSHRIGLSNNALGLHSVGIAIVNGIQELALPQFPRYEVGNSALVLGELISGSSDDYAHSIGVPLTLTLRLPGTIPRSSAGFILDPQYIQQVVTETWKGISAGVRRAGELVN
ncbi:unnamed protein product [Chrysodeixis includens]|uniref:Peptidase M14 domain-containing protein n=1 Tax=Chrysodeixis includens TaxID=689277 RepID=A0A9P0FW39_CHRIL|nr:unnamed protein product [Chrysodeixis includens]